MKARPLIPIAVLPGLRGAGQAVATLGAALVLAGTLSPWAQATLLRNIQVSIPGVLLAGGGACLAVALLVLLGARRVPLLCLAGTVVVLMQTRQAAHDIPHLVRHQIIGAQLGLFPLNRLLDQFHIANVQAGDWTVPDAQMLGAGLLWTTRGGWLLLAGALAGLPSDPVLGWIAGRAVRARCRACDARWPRSRGARFCPQCGMLAADPGQPAPCPRCGQEATPGDCHCIACGTDLNNAPKLPYSLQ